MAVSTKEYQSGDIPPVVWRRPAWSAIAAALGVLVLFHTSFWSMASIWWFSDTFAHGMLIFPISAWLIWDKRRELARINPRPAFQVLLLIPVAGCAWLVGHLAGLPLLQHLTLITLIILVVWCILGTQVVTVLAFPLGYLYFAVPLVALSDALIPPMMEFTADFTVNMLTLVGIPVYQDGTQFSTASGNWSVEKVCSGIRYLIAALTLGFLFAYLTYRSMLRRAMFLIFAIVIPIIANGLRAFLIVFVAHASDRKFAVGVDHLIYGWLFFGIVLTIMFLIGAIWREPREVINGSAEMRQPAQDRTREGWFVGASLASLLTAAIWPGVASAITRIESTDSPVDLQVPGGVAGWRNQEDWVWMWWPRVASADGEFYQFYERDGQVVALYLGQFRNQRKAVDVVDSQRLIFIRKPRPDEEKRHTSRTLSVADRDLVAIQSKVNTIDTRVRDWSNLLVWHWYRFGDTYTSSPQVAKLLEVWSRLADGRKDASVILVAALYEEDPETAADVLQSFTASMLPEIERALDRSVGKE